MQVFDQKAVDQFIREGFLRLDHAFPPELAAECRDLLWPATGCDPQDPSTWTRPVIRLGEMGQEPFRQAANTPRLRAAYDQLAGAGHWLPRNTLGSFPVRFPGDRDPGDTGWHVDASFPGDQPDNYLEWRINVHSKGRALLMLFLFSDVGPDDAPTRIRAGSHLEVARLLAPAGERGLSFLELAQQLDGSEGHGEVWATGVAGTVYLCHPFLVHAAQPHRGKTPKFMAQPPLLTRGDFDPARGGESCPVGLAIKRASTA